MVWEIADTPYDELVKWHAYFEQRPYGWQEDDRAYKIIMAQGAKARPGDLFPSLAKMHSQAVPQVSEDGMIQGEGFKNSFLFSKLLSSKGGDKIPDA